MAPKRKPRAKRTAEDIAETARKCRETKARNKAKREEEAAAEGTGGEPAPSSGPSKKRKTQQDDDDEEVEEVADPGPSKPAKRPRTKKPPKPKGPGRKYPHPTGPTFGPREEFDWRHMTEDEYGNYRYQHQEGINPLTFFDRGR